MTLVTTTIMGSKSFARFLIVCMLSFAVRITGKLPGIWSISVSPTSHPMFEEWPPPKEV
jgi:hypothetical protein